jgi:hypothetical protein
MSKELNAQWNVHHRGHKNLASLLRTCSALDCNLTSVKLSHFSPKTQAQQPSSLTQGHEEPSGGWPRHEQSAQA